MYEHECESDEDCEVYFLKPVNEYNIVDKIKEANKQLFAESPNENSAGVGGACGDVAESCSETIQISRKVTFAVNLEDYEPVGNEENTLDYVQVEELDELQLKLKKDFKAIPVIDEETTLEDSEEYGQTLKCNEIEEEMITESAAVGEKSEVNVAKAQSSSPTNSGTEKCGIKDDEVVEEICEEIIVMDMENDMNNIANTAHPNAYQRRMHKQETFDYGEQDNKSLTNLLNISSDCEEDASELAADSSDYNDDAIDVSLNESNKSDITANDNNDEDGNDDDEDEDDLSIIVASYIPDDYGCPSSTSESEQYHNKASKRSTRRLRVPSALTKRFTLRRKTNSMPNLIPPPEVTDLKLNYRICCEYRQSVATNEKLPKYTGYLSEYGLSREQLVEREERLKRKQHFVLEKTLKTTQAEMCKMQDNERAFTTWLKNKMRFPINKTRNMFDVKVRSNSSSISSSSNINSSGSYAVRNSSNIKSGKSK